MNRDDILRMAREACNGKQLEYFNGWGVVFDYNRLETFANLVAAAEREACIRNAVPRSQNLGSRDRKSVV